MLSFPSLRSVTAARIVANLETIELTSEDLASLDNIGHYQRVNTPAFGWDLGFSDWYGPYGPTTKA